MSNRCILAATDGESGSIGALRCARDIASRLGLPMEVISVCEPRSTFGYDSPALVAGVMQEMVQGSRDRRRRQVVEQLARAGVDCQPLISVELGSPAPIIALAAQLRGSPMIVTGLGNHSALDRLLADETVLRLMQTSRVPVLSVPPDYGSLPRRALTAIDFTSYSLDAAHAALSLLASGGELHLVHVVADHGHHGLGSWRHSHVDEAIRQEATSRLEAVAIELAHSASGVGVTPHLLEGRPGPAVLRLAQDLDVDLLAAGTNGYGLLGRLLMGSVATHLVRHSTWMTLVSPPRAVASAGADPRRELRHAHGQLAAAGR